MKNLLISLLLSAVGVFILSRLGIPQQPLIGLSILLIIGLLWMTEAIHLTTTALLVPVLAIALGVLDVTAALVNFAHPLIFLFLAGFSLAAALKKHEMDTALAYATLKFSGNNFFYTTLLLFCVTAGLSMMISNTATTAMMLPLAIGIVSAFDGAKHQNTYVYVLLGVAYSASIGGIGTLVGSPPNALAAASIGLDFAGWLVYGLPAVLLLFPIMVTLLFYSTKPDLSIQVNTEQDHSFSWDYYKRMIILIFSVVVILWIGSRYFGALIGVTKYFDTFVGLLAIVILCLSRTIRWTDIQETTDWGVLLLFGGGITLSAVLKKTGAGQYLGEQISFAANAIPSIAFVLFLLAFVIFLTELVSNTAIAALLLPILVPIAESIKMSSVSVALCIGIGASCAFMLPVATPPNALVFGTGCIPQHKMIKVGLQLNLVAIIGLGALAMVLF
jgi:sodium-dependent dicarboxylate transporter 2/3/5